MTDPAPQPVPKKKSNVLLWILGGCGGLVLLGILIFLLIGFFVGRKISQAGKNPAVAAVELMVRANPELELVSSDYDQGTLTVRNVKTGETLTLDAKEAEKGNFRFRNAKGEEVTISGGATGGSPAVRVQGADGSEATLGAGSTASLPDWAPAYPGADSDGAFNATSGTSKTVTVVQKTNDSVAKVMDFYESRFKSGGFQVSRITTPGGGMVTGEDKATHRTVSVMVGTEDGRTVATLASREGEN